jgi:hypothetical protein
MTRTTDPRIERVRKLVPDATTWPNGILCMKRIVDGKLTGFGRIVAYSGLGPVTIYDSDRVGVRITYSDLDKLIEAGWLVD